MLVEWDEEKAATNKRKHRGVSFEEAATIFNDPLATTINDPDHSEEEHRLLTTGMSDQNRVLIVSHTFRGDRIRLISARKATRFERKVYEEGN